MLLFLCVIILIGRFDLPESPLWLIRQGRIKECNEMMIKLFGEPVVFEAEDAKTTRFIELFNKRHFSFVLFVAVIWTCCQEVIPMFAILYLWPSNCRFIRMGYRKKCGVRQCRDQPIFYVAGCIPAMFWLNQTGRRPLLIGSFAMMTLALSTLGIFPNLPILFVILAFATYAFFLGRTWHFYSGFIRMNYFQPISEHRRWGLLCR